MELGAHLIVIAGRNERVKKQVEELREGFDPSNSLTVFGFTDRVSDLMAVSDVLITKPGPGTINEAIAMKLPMLIDDTEISLFWERANVDYVLKYKVGQKIRKFWQMDNLLMAYLGDEDLIQKTKQSFDSVPANEFHIRVKGIIKELMAIPPGWLADSKVAFVDSDEDEFDLEDSL
jgi:processive 1,2-diacylglycerol beta-glucosyltransferase